MIGMPRSDAGRTAKRGDDQFREWAPRPRVPVPFPWPGGFNPEAGTRLSEPGGGEMGGGGGIAGQRQVELRF